MRSMQRFHQEDRGWDDIGYSFVAGSDGYLYEGRGWEWQGAHTRGHNSKGYGVSFIGDFTSVLPDASALALVRDSFTKCAVQGARLVPDFTVHGHRQVVNTSSPGDALYSEITTWKHFKEVQAPGRKPFELEKQNKSAFSFHMDDVIQIVEDLERLNPELEILDAVELLRSAGHYDSEYLRLLLGDGMRRDRRPVPSELSQDQTHFISSLLNHKVSGDREGGVVLTPDGTSVAVSPLLAGIEAGLKRKRIALESVDVLYAASLAKHLGLSFVGHHRRQNSERLGPDGCWDDVKTPRVFTLMGDPSPATDALINGALDGVILGDQLSKEDNPPVLSALLKRYYQYGAEAAGSSPGLQSRFRRRNFAALVSMPVLQEQTVNSLILYRELSSLPPLEDSLIEGIVREGLQDFQQRYLDCPTVIPRCMWGAQPYRGTPTNLTLPLSFVYIHHTYQPAQPCTSFSQCAADMRSMQRFHQEDRGWHDIGYSFVAGSDGYLYEGRGWEWRGAHTKRHNSKGYGVSFIGDFTSVLPDASTLALVRDSFTKCAVQGARLVPDFTVHGHRQVVKGTSCPGDALHSEITTWKH